MTLKGGKFFIESKPTESPLLGGSTPYCNTISSAMYLSLLLLEIIYQGIQASTLSEHWCQPSPQVLRPAITLKQQKTFRKQQSQMYIFFFFFIPVTGLPHDPAQDVFTFSCISSLLRINDIDIQLVDLCTHYKSSEQICYLFFWTAFYTSGQSIMKDFLFLLPNCFDEIKIRKINGNLFPI